MKSPLTILATCFFLTHSFAQGANAIIWADPDANAPTEQTGVFENVGRLRYTRLRVFGGCCIWIGDRWVLTARHAVASWQPGSLSVDFPTAGKQTYAVQSIHLPADKKIDLALIKLKAAPPLKKLPVIHTEAPTVNDLIKIGGFGRYGPVAGDAGVNRFHHGENRIDSVQTHTAKFSMNRPPQGEPREALPDLMDSGSPVFVVADGKVQLAGITIRVTNAGSPGYGDRATFTRIDNQRDWIKTVREE